MPEQPASALVEVIAKAMLAAQRDANYDSWPTNGGATRLMARYVLDALTQQRLLTPETAGQTADPARCPALWTVTSAWSTGLVSCSKPQGHEGVHEGVFDGDVWRSATMTNANERSS